MGVVGGRWEIRMRSACLAWEGGTGPRLDVDGLGERSVPGRTEQWCRRPAMCSCCAPTTSESRSRRSEPSGRMERDHGCSLVVVAALLVRSPSSVVSFRSLCNSGCPQCCRLGVTLGQGARVVEVSERAQARPRTRLRLGDIGRLVAVWLVSSAALALAGALLPNLTAEAPWAYFAATAVAGLLGLVFRPVLALLAARIGWLAVVLAGLVGQALLVYLAIWIAPGINATFWSAFWASWIVAVIGTAVAWLGSAGTDDSFTASLLRRRAPSQPVADPEVDGVVFVQLDGVAFPVLRWAIQAGGWTLRRWVTSGTTYLESGRHSCPAPRRPVSWGSCMARWRASPPFAGTTVTWVES